MGFGDSHLCATTSSFLELGNPRPGALLDFLCLSKTCQAGSATFLPLFFPDTSKMPRYQEANEEQGFLTIIPKTYKDLQRPPALLRTCCWSLKYWSVFLKIVREELSKVRSKSNALCLYHYCWPLSRESKMHPLKPAASPVAVSIIIFTCTGKNLVAHRCS